MHVHHMDGRSRMQAPDASFKGLIVGICFEKMHLCLCEYRSIQICNISLETRPPEARVQGCVSCSAAATAEETTLWLLVLLQRIRYSNRRAH